MSPKNQSKVKITDLLERFIIEKRIVENIISNNLEGGGAFLCTIPDTQVNTCMK